MPQGEPFWNPYRWVCVSDEPVARQTPSYHHHWSGFSGRFECRLTALTPLLIGDGSATLSFVRKGNRPYIPATSLKGAIRALAELVGNAAIPFPKGHADKSHTLEQASSGDGRSWQLDIVARTFGYLNGNKAFAGLVRISDGILLGETSPIAETFKVPSGNPKPTHQPFYLTDKQRKFYHHHPNAKKLVAPYPGLNENQIREAHPLPPGVQFQFRVDFENFRQTELELLTYCLFIEEDVSVTLSRKALNPNAIGTVELKGPLRHKIGGCKPQGAGSVHVEPIGLILRESAANRYRAIRGGEIRFEGEQLGEKIAALTTTYRGRQDPTMLQLRSMLVYDRSDPRTECINYPKYDWFQEDKLSGDHKRLKPTL
jgi:CRISPR/Cas system CSM-associated protein Csm3 (group 7 of RAMP superfamily)